jgi:hypothetical protein
MFRSFRAESARADDVVYGESSIAGEASTERNVITATIESFATSPFTSGEDWTLG